MFDSFTFQQSNFDTLPEGSYYAQFIGTEEAKTKFEDNDKAVAWKWRILEGEHKGKCVSRVTGVKPTLANGCGKIIVGLTGKSPAASETVNINDCIGKRYLIQVVKTKDGKGTRVESATRLPD